MAEPFVSILWLNYNSMHIIDIVLRSLEAIAELDYENYEVVIVDNASTDGSFEKIREFVDTNPELRRRAKIVRNRANLGFAGGMNVAFRARDRRAEYVALVNNDAVPTAESLRRLVEEMEARPKLGAAQGVIMKLDAPELVDTAGDFINDLLMIFQLLNGRRLEGFDKPIYISYADGAYMLLRVKAALDAMGEERLFIDELFAYCDDNVLGFLLWTKGWRIASFPFIAGYHRRGATFGKAAKRRLYYGIRCSSFIYHSMQGIPLKARLFMSYLRFKRTFTVPLAWRDPSLMKEYVRAWREGKRLAEKMGLRLSYQSIPRAPVRLRDLPRMAILARFYRPYDDPEYLRRLMEMYRLE